MALVLVVVTMTVLTAAERDHEGARRHDVQESNYGVFRHMGPDDTVVNLSGGEDAREDYQLSKIQDVNRAKNGVNELRRRRRSLTVDSDNW